MRREPKAQPPPPIVPVGSMATSLFLSPTVLGVSGPPLNLTVAVGSRGHLDSEPRLKPLSVAALLGREPGVLPGHPGTVLESISN